MAMFCWDCAVPDDLFCAWLEVTVADMPWLVWEDAKYWARRVLGNG